MRFKKSQKKQFRSINDIVSEAFPSVEETFDKIIEGVMVERGVSRESIHDEVLDKICEMINDRYDVADGQSAVEEVFDVPCMARVKLDVCASNTKEVSQTLDHLQEEIENLLHEKFDAINVKVDVFQIVGFEALSGKDCK